MEPVWYFCYTFQNVEKLGCWDSAFVFEFIWTGIGARDAITSNGVCTAGPQSQKWSDQQITLNPTGSIHKKAREKKFDPKKVDFDEGVFI